MPRLVGSKPIEIWASYEELAPEEVELEQTLQRLDLTLYMVFPEEELKRSGKKQRNELRNRFDAFHTIKQCLKTFPCEYFQYS